MSGDSMQTEWLQGWDDTPGIVSVWANDDGVATIWRRTAPSNELVREQRSFRPWILLDSLEDLKHVGSDLQHDGDNDARYTWRELEGAGELRYLVRGPSGRMLRDAVVRGASMRLGEPLRQLRDRGDVTFLMLPPDEQFLVESGCAYFREFTFDKLRRLQFDLETTGLDPRRNKIFMIAVRNPDGTVELLEAANRSPAAESDLIRRFVEHVAVQDPDVIENHNLHGFDLPFLAERASQLNVPLTLGRMGMKLRHRAARRGVVIEGTDRRRRFVAPGREMIDTMDAVLRYDFSTRELPGHGLKAVARHFGLAGPERELIRGDQIYATYRTDPDRVRRYAGADVEEVAGLARLLGGAAFALARFAPRRYERLADAGAATGVIDPMLVRAYLRSGRALPAHHAGDGTVHTGAALFLFASGAAQRVVKADVASLYPSLMRTYRIGPSSDSLGALLAIVDRFTDERLRAKALAKRSPEGSAERHTADATSAAMKIVINSAYGYLAAGGLTRFADVHAANDITRRGRELLSKLCSEIASRGATLLEADTDGVYFAVPKTWIEEDERRLVSEVAALLPPLVSLEFEGRYQAMLSHEPKNYALLHYDGSLTLRGVAFRSSRAEPFGEAFLREAVRRLLLNDIEGVRALYVETIKALRARAVPTRQLASRVRLTKDREHYLQARETRRELAYEALLATRERTWSRGDKVRVYRGIGGEGREAPEEGEEDPRNYDVEHYVRVLRDNYASRLAKALAEEDFAEVFADVDQLRLFERSFAAMSSRLVVHENAALQALEGEGEQASR